MKQFFLCLALATITPIFNFAQAPSNAEQKVEFKDSYLINEQLVTLHSTYGKSLRGKNFRTIISFTIPRRTAKWFYSFTTVKSGSTFYDNLKLGIQISKALPMPAPYKVGLIALDKIIDNIQVPNSTKEINSFVVQDYQSAINFQNGLQTNYMINTEMFNTKSGKKDMKHFPAQTYYLCLENLSELSSVDVKIEAVAVVMETINQ